MGKLTNIGMEVVAVGNPAVYHLLFNGKSVGSVVGPVRKGMTYYGKPAIRMTMKQWVTYTQTQVEDANAANTQYDYEDEGEDGSREDQLNGSD